MTTGTTTFIYALNDPRTGLMRYIGKADDPQIRLSLHLSSRNTKDHRGAWIRSLLQLGLKPELQVLYETPVDNWQEVEKKFIRVYRSLGFDLTNTTDGGDNSPMQGRKHTAAARSKMSVGHLGKKRSIETNAKITAAQRGQKRSPETSAKISAKLRGRKHSLEAREKMSLAKSGKNNPHFGKSMPAETRAKIGAANFGKDRPPEFRERIRKALQGRKVPQAVLALRSLSLKAAWARRKEREKLQNANA